MAKAKPRGCKNCAHVDKNGMPRSRGPWKCAFPFPDLPPLPEAVSGLRWPPATMGVWSDDGAECPTWAEPGEKA